MQRLWECCVGSLPAGSEIFLGVWHNNGIIQNMKSETGEVCIPNISVKERRRRLKSGLIMFGAGLAVLAVLLATGLNPWWRAILFLPFAGAASGFFQWRDKT